MYFFFVFLIGLCATFLFIKLKSEWAKWVPAIVFFLAMIMIGIKILLFPAPEMAVLGEIVYGMILGAMTIGATIGGTIIHFLKKRKSGR
ncbi:hypothetical protein [Pseudoneobacillus sp. C159]